MKVYLSYLAFSMFSFPFWKTRLIESTKYLEMVDVEVETESLRRVEAVE